MTGRRRGRKENLERPPLLVPRPRGGVPAVLRWATAAVLLGIAALLMSTKDAPATPAPRGTDVVIARRDIASGTLVNGADVEVREVPNSVVPRAALHSVRAATGHTTSVPVRSGEVVTDVRLLSGSLATAVGGDDSLATPVRFSDSGAVRLLTAGERLDVVATSTAGSRAGRSNVVVSDAGVLSIPKPTGDDPGDGALVVLATTAAQARALASTEVESRLSFTLRHR